MAEINKYQTDAAVEEEESSCMDVEASEELEGASITTSESAQIDQK